MHKTQSSSTEMNPSATLRIYDQLSSCVVKISQVFLY